MTSELAVGTVISEPVSAGDFPVKRENTGIFADSPAELGPGSVFRTASQIVTAKFPTHLNREIFGG
jgi:hypothetical protein